jgi:hypothetical protein
MKEQKEFLLGDIVKIHIAFGSRLVQVLGEIIQVDPRQAVVLTNISGVHNRHFDAIDMATIEESMLWKLEK